MLSIDLAAGTGVCAECGPVSLGWKNDRGRRVPRCSVAQTQQKNSPNRHLRDHGLNGDEAQVFRTGKTCVICESAERLTVDHDHVSGEIRGVLCSNCNVGLGLFADSVERLKSAIAYLSASAASKKASA
jgi:hypothetical protein